MFLTNGDEKKEGNFVLGFPGDKFGDPAELAKEVMKLLDAKGFGKNGRWQVEGRCSWQIEIFQMKF